MKSERAFECFGLAVLLFFIQANTIKADDGLWVITSLPYQFAEHPVINDSGEIVWAGAGGGIFSSVRGMLSFSGVNPHLANNGEVVYADWFGGPNWDLVSTIRGRLTQGGIVNINASDFNLNTNGEVVYIVNDTNGYAQVYSTVRGQITFDATDHSNPCINDKGEILWNQLALGTGYLTVSSVRGILPGINQTLQELNNSGDYCYSGYLDVEGQPGYHTFPHIFSSAHGVIIDDSTQYQWNGSINDAGTIVWLGQGGVYEANWVVVPIISIVPEVAGFALEWPTNTAGFHVQYTTNQLSTFIWQALIGNPTTNGVNFHLTSLQNLGNHAFFRLSNVNP